MKIMKSGVLGDMLASLLTPANKFLKHYFIKRKLQFFKGRGKTSVAVLQIDFAENDTTSYQDEIQAAH